MFVSEVHDVSEGGKSSPCDCEPCPPVVGGWQEGDEGESLQAGGQGAGRGEDHLCGKLAQRRGSRVIEEGAFSLLYTCTDAFSFKFI